MRLSLKKFCLRKLKIRNKSRAGRNYTGKIVVRHKGGSHLKKFNYLIDYSRFIWNTPCMVRAIIKSPAHSAYLALVIYPIGIMSYIIAPNGLKVGQILMSGESFSKPIRGYNMLLKNIPLNIKIHNIEFFPFSGAKLVRSAGNWAKITEKTNTKAILLLKNGKKLNLNLNCAATVGRVSNLKHKKKKINNKAGQARNLNIRPHVRGVAMNAADHPHGGGKGKKSPKNPNYNFKRKMIKGKKTVKNKNE